MSKNIGIDIVEFKEIRDRLSDRFVARILSPVELNRYNTFQSEDRKLSFLAGRFAAKEAYAKVYRKFDVSINFNDITIENDEHGAPYIISPYRSEDKLLISISHSRSYAVSIVSLEEEG